MNPENLKAKLVGNEDQRAVSPVIGVILMVAITVILAAVIAAFVLDLGGSVSQEAQAGVTIEVDEQQEEIQVEVTSLGNADHVNLKGDIRTKGWYADYAGDNIEDHYTGLKTGDVVTIGAAGSGTNVKMNASSFSSGEPSGTVTATAVIEEDSTETQVASEEFNFDYS
ncbi:type IV pilin [Natrinema gari]|uniref:type IV pilin n=1 Tax=Natrinema gari TaxID=419186 RepID=UPI000677FF04|nr:type IV pilin N-terminal domain-containing protein [Natrinema gari]